MNVLIYFIIDFSKNKYSVPDGLQKNLFMLLTNLLRKSCYKDHRTMLTNILFSYYLLIFVRQLHEMKSCSISCQGVTSPSLFLLEKYTAGAFLMSLQTLNITFRVFYLSKNKTIIIITLARNFPRYQ